MSRAWHQAMRFSVQRAKQLWANRRFGHWRWSVRAFIVLAVMLPTVLVALLLSGLLISHHYDDLELAFRAHLRAAARQLGVAAEFGIFTANHAGLANLAQAALQGDAQIVSVGIFDAHGRLLAYSGAQPAHFDLPRDAQERLIDEGKSSTLWHPIVLSVLPVIDLYADDEAPEVSPANTAIGYVLIEASRAGLDERRNRLLLIGGGVALLGLSLGLTLALAIARRIAQPLQKMTEMVQRIGQGEQSDKVASEPGGALHELESGINAMADRIALAQDTLRHEVEQATAELRRRKEEAERSTAAKTRFLAAASHDLRQPLHALGLFVSRLAQYPHAAEVGMLVRNIDASVRALQDLFDALLDISRLDAGAIEVHRHVFRTAELFARLDNAFGELASVKGLRLRLRPGSLWLDSDPILFERIAMNLLSNAIRYTEQGGVLLVCRRRGDRARFEVWDSGPGIPEHLRQDIFEEYVQIGNPERAADKGLGLGLAICKRLAHLLGHRLGLASRPGHGSVFWVELPLGVAPAEEAVAIGEAQRPGRIEGTVLVVDDDAASAASMVGLIASWGCRAIPVSGVQEAIVLCDEANWRPDVAICDPSYGGEVALDCALQLRQRYQDLAILLVSGDVSPDLAAGARTQGFMLLQKPVRPARLRALLQHLLHDPA